MVDTNKLNEIVQQVLAAMPAGLKNLPEDLHKNLRSAIQAVFSKMDLITREEFDAQVGVLQKTRKKLEALEKQIKSLEQKKKK